MGASSNPAAAAAFRCRLCDALVGSLEIVPAGVPRPWPFGPPEAPGDLDDPSKERLCLEYPGFLSRRRGNPETIAKLRPMVAAADAAALYAADLEYVPLFCRECDTSYCLAHWSVRDEIIPDGGPFFEHYVHGICPEGHQRFMVER